MSDVSSARPSDSLIPRVMRLGRLSRGIGRLLPRSIGGRLALLLLVVLVPEVAIEVGHYYNVFSERRERELQANLEMARSVAITFDTYTQNILQHESTLGVVLAPPGSLTTQQMNRLLAASAQEYPWVNSFSWMGLQGRIVASSDPQAVGMDAGDSDYYRQAIAGR